MVAMELLDRVDERPLFDRFVDAAASGLSGGNVPVGDAGMEKIRLLEHAIVESRPRANTSQYPSTAPEIAFPQQFLPMRLGIR
jgi:hypothetical protein